MKLLETVDSMELKNNQKISLKLGDEIQTIIASSTCKLNIGNFKRETISFTNGIFNFEYQDDSCGFAISNCSFFSGILENNFIINFSIVPIETYLKINELIIQLQSLFDTFAANSWQQTTSFYFPLELLKDKYSNEGIDNDSRLSIRKFTNEGNSILVDIQRNWRSTESLPIITKINADLFSITLSIFKN